MSIMMSNKLLQATEQKIEGNLTPDNRQNYLRVVVAGMQAGMRGGPNSIIASIRHSKDPVSDAAVGAVNLALLMRGHSRGTMPLKAMVPAAMTLMLKALDFAEKLGIVKITNDELSRATRIFANTVMQRFGITAPKVVTAMHRVHAIISDPQKMELLKRRAGMVKAPNSSEPTGGQP